MPKWSSKPGPRRNRSVFLSARDCRASRADARRRGVMTFARAVALPSAIRALAPVLAPTGTPKPVLDRLSREVAAAMRSPEATARYGAMGAETIGSTPEEFASFLRSEIAQYARVIEEAGLKAELAR